MDQFNNYPQKKVSSEELKKLLEQFQSGQKLPEDVGYSAIADSSEQITPEELDARAAEQNFQDMKARVDSAPETVRQTIPITKQELKQTQPSITSTPEVKKDYSDEEMKNAIEDYKQRQLTANLAKAGETAAAAIARRKADYSYYDDLAKQAEDPMRLLKASREAKLLKDETDPNSPSAQAYRELYKRTGGKADLSGASSKAIKDLIEQTRLLSESEENRKARLEAAQLRNELMKQNRDEKQEQKDTQRLDKMNELVDASVKRQNTAFGRAANNLFSINSARQLFEGKKSLDEITPQESVEVARILDRMLAGGQSTVFGTKKLTPETAKSAIAEMMQKVTNMPQGAQLGAFMERSRSLLDREERVAKEQIANSQKSLLGSYKDLYKKYPERFKEILEQKGIPSDIMEAKPAKEEPKAKAVIDPTGVIRMIPADQVEAALKAGGRLAE